MRALQAFEKTMSRIDLVQRRADQFADGEMTDTANEGMQRVAEAQDRWADLQSDGAPAGRVREAEVAWEDEREALRLAEEELEQWRLEGPRRTAVAYCTAFETFLRTFLVEE